MASPENIRSIIRTALDDEDAAREEAFSMSRDLVRRSRERIAKDVATDGGAGPETLADVKGAMEALLARSSIDRWGFVEDAVSEAAEALVLNYALRSGDLPEPERIGVPARCYVLGACDAVGEVRRCVLNALLAGRTDRARELFSTMSSLALVSEGLVYPSGMINLKKKQDTVRMLLDRTQGELAISLATRGAAEAMDDG